MARDYQPEAPSFDDEAPPSEQKRPRRAGWILLLGFAAALALYYPLGMFFLHAIDDDPDFAAPPPPIGASRAVALAASLIEREVDRRHWAANDPFFLPGAMLDNMPAFQTGVVAGLARATQALAEQTRPRGQARLDADLDRAVGLLKSPGNVWIFDWRSGFGATASSEAQYRAARKALGAYNERLSAKRAALERRPDALLGVLEAAAADIDAQSALIEAHIAQSAGNLLDLAADEVFFAAKGRLYAYSLFLRELGADFDRALAEKKAEPAWKRMLGALGEAAQLHPLIVFNGAPDSVLLPSHLAGLGYAILRARARMAEAAAALR
ncbi:MAG: DUF2333 family protein [Rhodospirillales bacterium]